ncbi:MAG: UDP-N-acetylmuramoyl-tripeptide--D-alanyl-D-alanine ligase [Aestuariivita sp.]|nr:UDP-N-acetylmuramoyl-tripeptide--D-alanyl-D-alanine ligase [Aestuariivita sp.]
MTLWTSQAAMAATGGQTGSVWHATGVSIDTRTLNFGDLFVAISARRNGHDFVHEAFLKGSAAALVSQIPDGMTTDKALLVVSDVQQALEKLAVAARVRSAAKLIAVTGSVGKTTTKEMITQILTDQDHTHASVASYNNHWGVPLTLARMPAYAKFGVMEIGMNRPGEIRPLARMVCPNVAVITAIGAAHIEFFNSEHGVAIEKASIFSGLKQDGIAIINADSPFFDVLLTAARMQNARIVDFGYSGKSYRLEDIEIKNDVMVVKAVHARKSFEFKLNSVGEHFAINALAALAAAEAVGVDLKHGIQSLEKWLPGKGRGAYEIIQLDPSDRRLRLMLIDDSYNANPASMTASLSMLVNVHEFPGGGEELSGRRIAILGDMLELGSKEKQFHISLARHPAIKKIDVIHCIGTRMAKVYSKIPRSRRGLSFKNVEEAAHSICSTLSDGDVVLVKGSYSMELGQLTDKIRKMDAVRNNKFF